ncbi:4-hydroxyphenylpyruvate dioxygenase [Streptomyces sp. NPDC093097]|uniref:4-hydroxyphenylpyruvate dioxygenase n=1 Tax=Streptomyces sp. NPDC093097 TaxID=3366027 RepID=UPI00381E1093
MTTAFDGMTVDHIELYVTDLAASRQWLGQGYGFGTHAMADTPDGACSVALGSGDIRMVLTEARTLDHPGAAYTEKHGDGVGRIGLRVADATAAYNEAVRRGARPVIAPQASDGIVTASIMAFGDVVHTFVERAADLDERLLPGFTPVSADGAAGTREPAPGMRAVDHFAVCLEAGTLDSTVDFYERVLGFSMVFSERIVVGDQAMDSKVVQSASGAVTLTLIEPDLSREPGQIDAFIKNHDGAGVQHIAFAADDIVHAIGTMRGDGVAFLSTPQTYYTLLTKRLELSRHTVDALSGLGVLVDEDHDGQLFQIFTRSVHPRGTLFMEVIERLGAKTFGSGNIKALYEAVELQQAKNSEAGVPA